MSSGWGRGWSQPYLVIESSESESDSDCSSDTPTLPVSSDSPTLPVSSDRSYKEICIQAIGALSKRFTTFRRINEKISIEQEKLSIQLKSIEQEYLVADRKAQRRTHSMNLRASTDTQRQQRRMPSTQRRMLKRLRIAMY